MGKLKFYLKGMIVLASVVIGLLIFQPTLTYSQTMNLAPHIVNLNASGSTLTIDANWGGYIPGGEQITGHSIQFYINGIFIVDAIDLSYCYIDNMFKATFNRLTIMSNPYVQSLANSGQVLVTISGFYSTTNQNNVLIPQKWDYLEIEKPGAKKK